VQQAIPVFVREATRDQDTASALTRDQAMAPVAQQATLSVVHQATASAQPLSPITSVSDDHDPEFAPLPSNKKVQILSKAKTTFDSFIAKTRRSTIPDPVSQSPPRSVVVNRRRKEPVLEESSESEKDKDENDGDDAPRRKQPKRAVPVLGSERNQRPCVRCRDAKPPRDCWRQLGGRGACYMCGKNKVRCSLRKPSAQVMKNRKKVDFISPTRATPPSIDSEDEFLPPAKRQKRASLSSGKTGSSGYASGSASNPELRHSFRNLHLGRINIFLISCSYMFF
jgi:hypothetical protein